MSRKRMLCQSGATLAVLLAVLATACEGDGRYTILEDEEWSIRRSRLAVTVVLSNGDGLETRELPIDAVTGLALAECTTALRPDARMAQVGNCSAEIDPAPLSCQRAVCTTSLALCAGHRLRELAEALLEVSLAASYTEGGKTYEVTVLPPDAASRAALSEEALRLAQTAATYAGENIRSGLKLSADGSIAPCQQGELGYDPGDGLTYGASLSNDLVEALHLAEEAATAAVEANVAVADASFSENPSRGDAARAAWVAPVLSRLHAAELLAGGAHVAPGPLGPAPGTVASAAYVDWSFLSHGFAPTAPLSTSGRSALELLRQAGLHPNELYDTDTYDFEHLYDGLGAGNHGLRDALAELTETPELIGPNRIDAEEFLELYGLTSSDMLAARTRMREEAVAFGRDPAPTLPAFPLSTDSMGGAVYYTGERYVATTLPASAPPDMYYVRLARLHADSNDDRESYYEEAVRPAIAYARNGLVGTLDYGTTIAYAALENPFSVELGAGVESLGSLIEGEWERRLARVETCYSNTPYDGHRLTVSVYLPAPKSEIPPSDYRLVVGTAGLSCATRGNIDGAPCELAEHFPASSGLYLDNVKVFDVSDASLGFPGRVQFSFKNVDPNRVVDLYVVHRVASMPTGSAGAYEAYGSVHFDAFEPGGPTSETPVSCSAYGVFLGMDKEIYNTLAPRPSDASSPAAVCGAIPETRLPLENELIDDGDGVESSWRHHLDVARAAASYADTLGEEVIESGLAVDSRADAANEALLSACGASVDLDGLFGASAGPAVSPAPCPLGDDGEPVGLEVGARCVRLAIEEIEVAANTDRDARVLATCLGNDAVIPALGLGSRPVCAWHRVGDSGLLCDGATQTNRCPFAASYDDATDTYSCDDRVPDGATPADYTRLLVDRHLSFFGTEHGEPALTIPSNTSCTDVQNLRRVGFSASARRQALDRIIASNFFASGNVREWARQIGWDARARNHSALTINGVPWLQTGDIFSSTSVSSYWPCTNDLPGPSSLPVWGGGALGDSLFAQTYECVSPLERLAVGERMARGVLALALLSGVGTANMRLPVGFPLEGHISVGDRSVRYAADGSEWEFASLAEFPGVRRDSDPMDMSGEYFRSTNLPWYVPGTVVQGWIGFVSVGDLAPTGTDLRAELVPDIWYGLSSVGTGSGRYRNVYSGWVRGAVDAWDHPNQLVVDPAAWTRGSTCDPNFGPCHPNVLHLTDYWKSGVATGLGGPTNTNTLRVDALEGSASGLTVRDVLDGLEIMCEASRAVQQDVLGSCADSPPVVATRSDLPRMRQYLLCAANEIEGQGESAIIQGVPAVVVDGWVPGASSGDARSDGGAMHAAVLRARSALTQLSGVHRAIASVLRDVESEMQIVEIQLAALGDEQEILDLETVSGALDRVTACASSGSVNAGVAQCANAAAQIAISLRLRDLNSEMLRREETLLLIETIDSIQDHGDTLSAIATQVSLLLDQLNSALSDIHGARATAVRALANATLSGSDADGRSIPLNSGLTSRYDMRLARYGEARRNAVRLAHIARRALEQRLGSDLADLGELSLVDRPAGWVNRLCESTGVDYARLRDETELPYETESFMFVGDYVRRLEMVFESYRIDYPFHSGTDTAVVSLRDDVGTSLSHCSVDTYNLVNASGELAASPWRSSGCVPVDDGEGGTEVRGCIAPTLIDPGEGVAFAEVAVDGSAHPYRVVFGGGATGDPSDEDVSFGADAQWVQEVDVPADGVYVLSWYGRGDSVAGSRSAKNAVLLVDDAGLPLASSDAIALPVGPAGWRRYVRFYALRASRPVSVAVVPQGPFTVPVEEFVDVAAVQLEDVTGRFSNPPETVTEMDVNDGTGRFLPRPFVGTDATGRVSRRVCEASASEFLERWRPGCVRVCDDGLRATCTELESTQRCYMEMEFTLSARDIEQGGALGRSGFAYGNFNYRTEGLGLNFVGTAARQCDDDRFPSTCYSTGFVPYSLYHMGVDGGYEVRNHAGEIYLAQLFDGRIETADGLAAERYITNPVSSADRALLEGAMRREFAGRPIPGRYVLRVWDDAGVNFRGIEDVQVVLNYRYWTRID